MKLLKFWIIFEINFFMHNIKQNNEFHILWNFEFCICQLL